MTDSIARPATTVGTGAALVGTGTLVRFMLRRDRIRIPLWIAAVAVPTVATAASYPALYPTAADRQAQADIISGTRR